MLLKSYIFAQWRQICKVGFQLIQHLVIKIVLLSAQHYRETGMCCVSTVTQLLCRYVPCRGPQKQNKHCRYTDLPLQVYSGIDITCIRQCKVNFCKLFFLTVMFFSPSPLQKFPQPVSLMIFIFHPVPELMPLFTYVSCLLGLAVNQNSGFVACTAFSLGGRRKSTLF